MTLRSILVLSSGGLAFALSACAGQADNPVSVGIGINPQLEAPKTSLFPAVKLAEARHWAPGQMPTPAAGLKVTAFATGLDHPRWLHVLPNGDVLVAETNAPERPESGQGIIGYFQTEAMKKAGAVTRTANRISLLRDADGDGVAETRTAFLTGLNSPFGMALAGGRLYVANSDAVVSVPYGRAAIWEIDVASGTKRQFATGLRNPNGMDWEPFSGALWTAVNERDELGHNLVPDYMTSVKDGAFYGWPWSYFGQTADMRVKPERPDMVAKAIAPDYALGAHTASLGLTFADGAKLGEQFANGAFIGQHGSWNRDPFSGYKVIFVPFSNGKPMGQPIDVLTGFIDEGRQIAFGRPVGVEIGKDGALLVADDVGNTVWRVAAAGLNPPADLAATK